MNLSIKGTVHSLDNIMHESAYAKATFNSLDNIEVSAIGKCLHFQYTKPFITESIDALLTSLITDHSNVTWELTVAS
jgi:hypothetical protein